MCLDYLVEVHLNMSQPTMTHAAIWLITDWWQRDGPCIYGDVLIANCNATKEILLVNTHQCSRYFTLTKPVAPSSPRLMNDMIIREFVIALTAMDCVQYCFCSIIMCCSISVSLGMFDKGAFNGKLMWILIDWMLLSPKQSHYLTLYWQFTAPAIIHAYYNPAL